MKPDHIVLGFEHDESDAKINRGPRTLTSTNKLDAHVVYDLPK